MKWILFPWGLLVAFMAFLGLGELADESERAAGLAAVAMVIGWFAWIAARE